MELNMLAGYALMAATAGPSAWPGEATIHRGLAPVGWGGRSPVARPAPASGTGRSSGSGLAAFAGLLHRSDEPRHGSGAALAAP